MVQYTIMSVLAKVQMKNVWVHRKQLCCYLNIKLSIQCIYTSNNNFMRMHHIRNFLYKQTLA